MRATNKPFDWRVCLMGTGEPRGSRPVLREAGGAIPPAYSPSSGTVLSARISKHLATGEELSARTPFRISVPS